MHPSRQGISLLVWMVVFTFIITIVIALRFWAASIKRRPLRPDDYLIVIAFVSAAIAFQIIVRRSQNSVDKYAHDRIFGMVGHRQWPWCTYQYA